MLLAVIGAHLVVAVAAPWLTRWFGQRAFWLAAAVPAVSFGLLLPLGPTVLPGDRFTEVVPWIPGLGVSLAFGVGLVQWVLALIVTGIGALVLFYCRWYFGSDPPQTRVVGLLTAFCAAMIGLVAADDLVVVYVFWEATTVFSYLLIGHDPTRRANRSAALTALIVTTTGGLAMLVGLLGLGRAAGSFSLAAILAAPPSGPLVTASALLVLAGALSKSALVPFHFWLPGAMAAPTPISAYLHAAAMVKAGVYLVAVLAPVLATQPGWRPAVWALGAMTLFLGGWRALRQDDLKLLLAYGTVSQLGLLVLLVGTGTQAAALGGLAMLIAHALFKGTLFLVVGVVDHATGTRSLSRLSGLGRRLPLVAVVAALAAASMAGLPPTLGFIAKEAALEGVTNLARGGDGTGLAALPAWALVAVVAAGSAITVAYSLRFWWGAFWDKPGVTASVVEHRPEPGLLAGPVVLGALSLVGGFAGTPLTAALTPYAETLPGEHSHGLVLLPSPGTPLYVSLFAIAAGAVMFWQRDRIAAVQQTFPPVPAAADFYTTTMARLDRLAVEVTDRTQRGSLAHYVGTILVVVSLLIFGTLAGVQNWPAVHLADNWAQLVVGALLVVTALAVATSRGRLRAVVLLGVAGYGTALLFLFHGAPDLALTQVLVETVSLLVFLLVLRALPKFFTERPHTSGRWWRVVISAATGLAFTLVALLMLGSRSATPVSEPYHEIAYSFGYGNNIVNVVLVDTRAWDTLGEISVLAIAATGVASLIFLRGRAGPLQRLGAPVTAERQSGWLQGSRTLPASQRSFMFEVVTRLLFPIMIVVSVYLLVAGHNLPGGGFAGGLVAGTALLLRYLAGGGAELDEAMPVPAGALLGSGLVLSVITAVVPLTVGGLIFQSYDVHLKVPGWESLATPWGEWTLLGDVHLVSSTVFDIGVYLVVLGMMLDLGRSLGGGIDAQARQELTPAPEPESTRAIPGRKWLS